MSYAQHIGRSDGNADLVDALSDTPVTSETAAWFSGHARSAAVLERRLAALMPDAQPIKRRDRIAAWVSRRRSVTLVYWRQDGALELTVDDEVDQAIATILNDIVPAVSKLRDAAAERTPADDGPEAKRYGQAVSEPVITRVVAVADLPPGSRATRRLIAEWSDGTQSEALAWFRDEWLVTEGDLIGLTRDEVRALADRRDRDWLRDDPRGPGDRQPFFES
jgi:hypothetical protein